MAKQTADELVLPGEAAELLGISREGVRLAEGRGDIRAFKTRSGHRFFALSEVRAFKALRVKRLQERLEAAKQGGTLKPRPTK